MSFGRRPTERRSAPRQKIDMPGEILLPGRPSRPCQIIDLSRTGARLGLNSVFGIPDAFELRVGEQTFNATVVRKLPGRLHVKFG